MIKKIICIILVLLFIFPFAGCWNYRGLSDMTIVAGIAIDKNPENNNYMLTFEIIDLSGATSSEGSIQSKLVESEGKTYFDAARNAKKRMLNKLYFGNTQVIVVSNEIAKKDGLNTIVDWFLRDSECRETISVVISQQKTAKEILTTSEGNSPIVSYDIEKILDADNDVTSSAIVVQTYNAFDTLKREGISLTLPMFHCVINDEEKTSELNGSAIFKNDKMIGSLSPTESKYFLFVNDMVKGGILPISYKENEPEDISLEISENKTIKKYSYNDGKLKMNVKTNTNVFIAEFNEVNHDLLKKDEITYITNRAQDKLKKDIIDVIKKVQSQYDSDIFGFGNTLYKENPKLWSQLKNDWDEIFKTLEVDVECKINIINTAYVKKT